MISHPARWLFMLLLGLVLVSLSPAGSAVPAHANETTSQGAESDAEDPFKEASDDADAAYMRDVANLQEADSEWTAGFIRRSWEWHLLSTKIIFFLVIAIVLFGVFVSWLQFRHDIASPVIDGETGTVNYDVSATMQSISVKSKTIGAIVLLASTGFFLMYLIYVYPMHESDRAVERHLPSVET